MGAFASFTLGARDAQGGLGLELGRPASQSVYLGLESSTADTFELLPFCEVPAAKMVEGVDDFGRTIKRPKRKYCLIPDKKIRRTLTPSTDTWKTGELEFSIHSPVMPLPDPAKAGDAEMMLACVPAVTATLHIDNRKGKTARRFFFGFHEDGGPRAIRRIYDHPVKRSMRGVAYGTSHGIATDSDGVHAGQGFSIDEVLDQDDLEITNYGLGRVGLLVGTVPAGEQQTARFVICFHRSGSATTGLETKYVYNRFFPSLESVAQYGLRNFGPVHARGAEFDREIEQADLSAERRFMLSQSIHSYYGSTELLEAKDGPWWIVNEGEYRMMNTLDLTVDQLWFEMRMNPWTVRNTLDRVLQHYSYTDTIRLPGDPTDYKGGLSFTHDMGVANHFSPKGVSAYEKASTSGTFSSMTHEELLNWIICALVLAKSPGYEQWGRQQKSVMVRLLESLMRRDHPDPASRNGIMGADSSRCNGGSEITTYDSLDPALKQARGSIYLGVKSWGCYVGMADFFQSLGNEKSRRKALRQAHLAMTTLCEAVLPDGSLPALLEGKGNTLVIPAIEGLIVPQQLGLTDALAEDGEFGGLIRVLKKHLRVALDSKRCHFPDGGWRISSTSDNSWLSKIYLNQFIAEKVLGVASETEMRKADAAHAGWSLDEQNAFWAWSDQIINGKAIGSKYYPRGVTSILWLRR